jgi:hypothetical protein
LRARIKRTSDFSAARAIGSRVRVEADEVKGNRRKTADRLTDWISPGNTWRPDVMSAAFDTSSADRLRQAARGLLSILLVAILPR